VEFEGERWTIAPEDFGRFVVQETNPDPTLTGRDAVVVRIDETALATWLNEQFAAAVNRDPVDAEVSWDGEQVVALSESTPGYRIRPKLFARELNDRFFGDHATLEIPTNVVVPNVDSDNLAALGISSELARADSNFEGSDESRETNIRVGAGLLNGTLVPPGGEFSFSHSIGEITEELGYVGAKVIDGERIGRDIGGGICQVSTTVFRTALLAGMPMTEWNPHRYRLEFYERDGWGPGYDASILQPEGDPFAPGNDFKFYNSTNGWLLVEAYVTDIRVVVVFYGTDMGYEINVAKAVEEQKIPIDPPLEVVDDELDPGTMELTELPQIGSVWIFVREVRDANGNLVESREFRSIYHSRGYVWRVSPDKAGQSPAATGEGLPPDAYPEDWPLD
jgi:vancomycin resistance protein YoaR